MAALPPRSVLVVDDDPGSRVFLAEALEALGWSAIQASNAGEALRVLADRVPDLVCTDLRMPGVDGLEFISLARAQAPQLPLILVTANGEPESEAEAKRRGAAEMLRKPVSLGALAAALGRLRPVPSDGAAGGRVSPAGLDATLVQKATQLSVLTQFGSALGDLTVGSLQAAGPPAPDLALPPFDVAPAAAGLRSLVDRSLDFVLRALPGDRAALALTEEGGVHPIAARGPAAAAIPLEAVSARLRAAGGASWHGVLDGGPLAAALLAAQDLSFGFVCVGRDPASPPFTWADAELLGAFAAQTAVTLQNAGLRRQLERAFQETVTSLVVTLEARHKYTEGHSLRVARLARAIARAMRVAPDLTEQVRTASLLHDVGKVGVPDAVLDKPGRLTPEEWAAMRQHPVLGWKILQPLGFLASEALTVRHHHERFDGTGYPDGLTGQAIPMAARIIAVADSFDAMVSPRPYRPPLPTQAALAEIAQCAGTQYDPAVVDAFQRWYRRSARADMAA